MGTVNVVLGEDTRLNLILGQQLENAVTSVVFDFSAWQTTYGSGTLALSVQRPGDDQPYAVTLTTSGTDATWSVTNLDTAYKGVGHIQLTYTVGSAIKKSVVYKFTVYESLGANGEYPSPGQTWQEEMEEEIADVKADLAELEGGGLSDDAKQALLACFNHVGWDDDDPSGKTWVDALESALYPPADLVSISAVYTQSGTVYDTDTLDSLKADLVVTAHFSDSTTQIITSYTLSGSLTEGTSIVTATYGGKSATFNVTVTHAIPNTTAQIAKEGYIFSGTNGGETTKANGGETIKYQLDSPTTTLHPAGVIVNDGLFSTSSGQLQVYNNGTYVIYADEYNRWAKAPASSYTEYNSKSWTVSEYNQIAFSVDIRYLDDSYMYDYVTGQVWFAGINTPYYGMHNISEANS